MRENEMLYSIKLKYVSGYEETYKAVRRCQLRSDKSISIEFDDGFIVVVKNVVKYTVWRDTDNE